MKLFFKRSMAIVTMAALTLLSSAAVFAVEDDTSVYDSSSSIDNSGTAEYSIACDESISEMIARYVADFPSMEYKITRLSSDIIGSSNFNSAYSFDKEEALKILDDNLRLLTDTTLELYGLSNGIYSSKSTVPVVLQSTSENCGIAAALSALIGNGQLSNTTSNKSSTKQSTIETTLNKMFAQLYKGQAYQVTKVLNTVAFSIEDSGDYSSVYISSLNLSNVMAMMRTSLKNDFCPVIELKDTSYLEYYGNASYDHWVTVSKINDITGKVTVVDPFNSSVCGGKSSYGGSHEVTTDELLAAILGDNESWVIVYG